MHFIFAPFSQLVSTETAVREIHIKISCLVCLELVIIACYKAECTLLSEPHSLLCLSTQSHKVKVKDKERHQDMFQLHLTSFYGLFLRISVIWKVSVFLDWGEQRSECLTFEPHRLKATGPLLWETEQCTAHGGYIYLAFRVLLPVRSRSTKQHVLPSLSH